MKIPGPLLWLLLLLPLNGCSRQDTEALARLGKKLATRSEIVTDELRNLAISSWQGDADFNLESRVAARLRWDKQLLDTPLEVHATGDVVELQGKVRDLEQRRRAVMLAESTTGVVTVKDSLVEDDR
jgi:hypothetical protein